MEGFYHIGVIGLKYSSVFKPINIRQFYGKAWLNPMSSNRAASVLFPLV